MNLRITPNGGLILDYEPPKPVLNDTLLAFRAMSRDPWTNPSVSLRIDRDPLGGPNQILSLQRSGRDGSTRMGAVLYPIREGAVVKLGRENSPLTTVYGADWSPLHRWGGRNVWVVTVDDKRILEVPYHLALPDVPPAPPVPLWSRVRHWVTAKARSAADGVAGRAGYVREDEGGHW